MDRRLHPSHQPHPLLLMSMTSLPNSSSLGSSKGQVLVEDTQEGAFLVWKHQQHLKRKLLRQRPTPLSRRNSSSLQGKMVVRRVEDLSATAPSSQSSCSLYQGEVSTPASRRGSKGSSTCSTPARTCSARPVDSDTAGETLVSSFKDLDLHVHQGGDVAVHSSLGLAL